MIAAIVVSLLSLLVVAGAYFLYQEWRRYKLDKAPAPPPTPEEAALDRWNEGVVIVVAGVLFGKPHAVAAASLAISVAATLIPARRAINVDPMNALRHE